MRQSRREEQREGKSKVRGRQKSPQSEVVCGTEKRKGGQAVCVTSAGSTAKRKRVNFKDRTVSKVELSVKFKKWMSSLWEPKKSRRVKKANKRRNKVGFSRAEPDWT